MLCVCNSFFNFFQNNTRICKVNKMFYYCRGMDKWSRREVSRSAKERGRNETFRRGMRTILLITINYLLYKNYETIIFLRKSVYGYGNNIIFNSNLSCSSVRVI